MKIFILILFGFLSACVKLKPQPACNFIRTQHGERISWKTQVPVTIFLHTNINLDEEAAIKRAADSWNKALGRVILIISNTRTNSWIMLDNVNTIQKMYTWNPNESSQTALATTSFVGEQLKEADIRINAYNHLFYPNLENEIPNAINLEAVMVHELGHVLGLGHIDKVPSVMSTYLSYNQNKTELTQEDVRSLLCEY